MDIQIGQIGQIAEGDDVGSYVKVLDDTQNTGGFLILTSTRPDMSDGFDSWVENNKELSRYFLESGWVIEWL